MKYLNLNPLGQVSPNISKIYLILALCCGALIGLFAFSPVLDADPVKSENSTNLISKNQNHNSSQPPAEFICGPPPPNYGFLLKEVTERPSSSSDSKDNVEFSIDGLTKLNIYINGNVGTPDYSLDEIKYGRIEQNNPDHGHHDDKLKVGWIDSNNGNGRGLVEFDLSGVSGTVTHAELVINASTNEGSNPEDISVHLVTNSWEESVDNDEGLDWDHRDDDPVSPVLWDTPGADFDATVIDVQTVPVSANNDLITWTVTSTVAAWINSLSVDADPDMTICNGESTTISVSISNGTAPYTTVWDQGLGSGTSHLISPAITTTYTVMVTDAEGCEATDQVTVTVVPGIDDGGQIGFDEDSCEGFDPQEITNIISASGESNCTVEESCCVTGFKPAVLNLQYTGEDCSATVTTQDADKWNCDGDPASAGSVYIVANDDDNPDNGLIWFTGTVTLNEIFVVDASNAGETKLKSNTVIHIFDSEGGTLLQKVNFHTSCSQPLATGDEWGAVSLTYIVAEDGSTCGSETGGSGIAYQWQSRPGTTGTWSDITGATGETYDPPFISETMQYRRLALSCLCGSDVPSNIVTKSVFTGDSVDAGPDETICEGESAVITATASGGFPPYTFTWDQGLGSGPSHTVSPSVTTTYSVTLEDGNGCLAFDNVTITVTQPLEDGGEIGGEESHCGPYDPEIIYSITEPAGATCGNFEFTGEDCCDNGDKPISFVLLYNGESCAESLNNQGEIGGKWDCSGDAGGDADVYIEVNNGQFAGSVSLNSTFTVTNGGDNLTNPIEVTIYDTPGGTILQQIEIHTSCSAPIVNGDQFGSLVLLSSEFNDGFSCGGTIQSADYQWQQKVGTGPWTDIPGATEADYDPPFITETTQYRRLASNCGCGEESSNIITKTVTSLDPGEIEDDEINCGPFDPQEIVNVTSASDGEEPILEGVSCCESGFKPAVLTMRYTGEGCSATITTQPSDKWNCDGDPGFAGSVYIVANDDDNPGNGLIWFTGTVNLNETFIVDAGNAGESKLKSNTIIHIFDSPGGTLLQKVNFHTSCSQPLATGDQWGASQLLHIVAEDGNTCGSVECDLTYQWQSRVGTSGTFTDIPGATSENYDPPFITETMQYQRLAISCTCGTEASNIVTKEVTDGPNVSITVNSEETCAGNDGSLTANPTGGTAPYFYEWDDAAGSTTQTISGLTAGSYNVTITDSAGCESTGSGVIVSRCFDLALQKVVTGPGPYLQGDNISFTITVINQGTVSATNVEVTDYIPNGLTLNDASWAQSGNLATRTISGPIAANGGTASVNISFQIDNDFFEECIINCAEISGAQNPYGLTDWDSTFDQDKTNDAGGQPESPADDYIDGNGTGTPGDGVATTDEDDQDPAKIYLPVISHTKTITNVALNPDGVTYDATYEIVVTNSGEVPGQYDLEDLPSFDGDLSINSASFSSDAPGNPGNDLMGNGPWELADNQDIGSGDVHTYTLEVNISLNLTDGLSDDQYAPCGSTTGTPQAGEGLFNESFLDLNNDGDPEEIKWDCGDLPNKIGDYVWEDRDRDGIQDPEESGVPGITVNLKNASNIVIETTTTGPNGEYCFVDLVPGEYSVEFIVPYEYRFTTRDVPGDDSVDSDADASTSGMTHVVTVEETTIDITIDGGIYLRPFPGIADPCGCLNNSTTDNDGQYFEEIAVSHAYEGDVWVIIEQTGMYLLESPPPPPPPIPVPLGTELVEIDTADNDLSTYIYDFIHVEEGGYSVTVTNGFDTLSISNVCYYPEFIELDIPMDPLCVNDDPVPLSGVPNIPGTVNFYIDGNLVTEIDPALLGVGSFEITAEIIPDDPEECIERVITSLVVISDGCIADLALDKSLLSFGPFVPGGIVEYQISVTNEGTLDATTVEVTDYIPDGMTYIGGGWSVSGNIATQTITGLAVGATANLSIILKIDDDYQGTMLLNCAEISNDTNLKDEPDQDSTPDQNPNNDPPGEDDFDCEPITVDQTFDLALDKSLLSSGPFIPGSTVEYEISVTNEGTLDATNVEVTDYIPDDMSYVGGGWTVSGNIATQTIASLAVGATATLNIILQIDDDYQGTMLLNCAEISNDDNALDEPDQDSTPDQNPNNDPPGEDDYDCEPITVEQTFDLALDKSLLSNGPFIPGSTVEYEISVTNEGTLDATNVEVTDYIPNGMSYVGGGWTVSGGVATQTIASLAVGATTTLNIVLAIEEDYQGTTLTNCAEISEDNNALNEPDQDSTPDQNPNNDPPSEDDFDCEPITVEQTFDLALDKSLLSNGPFVPGSIVEYEISVTNEGTLDATNIEVTDYLPNGMSYIGGGWSVSGNVATQTIASLAVGATTTLNIILEIEEDYQGTTLINCAEISQDDNALDEPDQDSTPDQNPNNDPPGEDDYDCEPITVEQTFDLALDKERISVGPFEPGSTVVYEISVTNEGTLDATNVEVTDYIPVGMSYVGGGWSVSGNIATQTIGSLDAGATTTISITLMVDSDFEGTSLVNCAEISVGENALDEPDQDSTPDQNPNNDPPGEDDYDCAPLTIGQTFDLALDKSLLDFGPFVPGSLVEFEISVTNQGTLTATDVEVTDYIPEGMTYVSGGWNVSGGIATQVISSLASGASTTLNITLRIDEDYQGSVLTNCAEISEDNNSLGLPDEDSTPDQNPNNDPPGEDDFDCEPVTVEQTFDLALDKSLLSNGPFVPGSLVEYEISVTNEGTLDATDVEVTDYIPEGMNYVGGGWNVSGNFATQTIPALDVGETVSLHITLMIDEDYQGTTITNCAEISEDDNALNEQDVDSNPDQNIINDLPGEDDFDCVPITVEQTFDLALDKSLIGNGPFTPGSFVQFDISVTNEGTLDATNVEVTDYLPNGMSYVGGGWSVIGNNATQTIPFIGSGQTISLGITFRIDEDYQGDQLLNCAEISADDNVLSQPDVDSTPDQNPNNDPPGEDDYDCEPVTVEHTFDLALDKSLIGSGLFEPGSFVQFEISVTNEGTLDATDVEVTDYIPEGMNYVEGGWSVSGDVATQNIAFIEAGETVALSITFQIDDDFQGSTMINCAEISEDDNAFDVPDQDSTPDQNPNNDPPGEDDYDCEQITIGQSFDLSLDKSLIGNGPFAPGSFVEFEISVTNEGSLDATDVEVTDYIPNGMNYISGGWTVSGNMAMQTIPEIPVGMTATLSITFQVDVDYQGNQILNCAEISSDDNAFDLPDQDSNPDQNPNNDPPGEDDFDCEPVNIEQTFDLALDKELIGDGPFTPGSFVQFEISVTNEGTLDATNVEVTDYIPSGMNYVDGGWTVNGNVATQTIASIAVGQTVTLSITFQIDADYQGNMMLNCAEISDDDNAFDLPDQDSTPDQNPNNDPPGEDDFDCEPVNIGQTFDLALDKELIGNGPFEPGSLVEFEISVTNEGTLDATNVEVTDYIPSGMNYVDGGWTVSGNVATQTIASIAAGETVTLTITFQIDADYQGNMMLNCAEISEADNESGEPDVDSTPDQDPNNDPPGEDDFDCEPVNIGQTFDLALDKELIGNGPFEPGSFVEFEISVTNEGTLDATNVEVTDYIPSGMNYIDGGWTVSGNVATQTIASIAAGETVTLTIIFQIDADYQGNMMLNCAEISEADNESGEPDVDSTPDQDPNNDPPGEDDFDCEPVDIGQTFDLALDKELIGNGPFEPGSFVEFEISVTNEGTLDATNVEVTDYIPSGMNYVDGGWTVSGNVATQTVASIAAGETVTLTIIFQIDADYQGNMMLNCAEISEADNESGEPDVDSTPDQDPNNDPPGEDDFDCEPVNIGQTFDLALDKELISDGPFQPGDIVAYQIIVTNEGTLDATDVEVTDYIPDGLDYFDGGWSTDGNLATQTIDFIAVGETVVLTIVFQINENFQENMIRNCAEISEADNELDAPDVDSTPDQDPDNDPSVEDDHDCESIFLEVCDISVEIEQVECNDDGTFFAVVNIDGEEGGSWIAWINGDIVAVGDFPSTETFGPFTEITTILVTQVGDDNCNETIVIENPFECGEIYIDCPLNNHFCPILDEHILLYTTDPQSCTGTVLVPEPEVTATGSTCSSEEVIWTLVTEVWTLDGSTLVATILAGDDRILFDLPVGDYIIRYVVTDNCGDSHIQDCYMRVADLDNPVATCFTDLSVSLGGFGLAWTYTFQVDNASYDNCAIESIQVRRIYTRDPVTCDTLVVPQYSDWGDYVEFTCCDAGLYITVELRVIDIYGNENVCVSNILVEDNTLPLCYGLDNVTVQCDDLPDGFDVYDLDHLSEFFGMPIVVDNCAAEAYELVPEYNLADCGYGTLTRRFRAIDMFGNLSMDIFEQVVTIDYTSNYEIKLPADTETDCINDVTTVELFHTNCDSIVVTHEDVFLPVEGEECYNVMRTYHIINYCEWDGLADPVNISRDEDCDGSEGEEAVWVLRAGLEAYVDSDDSYLNSMPAAGVKGTDCDGETNPEGYWRLTESTGYWTYTQHVIIYDTIPTVVVFDLPDPFCTDSVECEVEIAYPFSVIENCVAEDLIISIGLDAGADGTIDADLTGTGVLHGSYPDYVIIGTFPIGTHNFVLDIDDGCGNTTNSILPFEIVDCYIPEIVCYIQYDVELGPVEPGVDVNGDGIADDGAVEVFGWQLASCFVEDCSGPLRFSVNRLGELPHPDAESVILTCEDIFGLYVEVYMWDNAYNPYAVQPDGSIGGPNYDYCEVLILVDDPLGLCPECGPIADLHGRIATITNKQIQGVDVSLLDAEDDSFVDGDITDEEGLYDFWEVLEGENYIIKPARDGDDINGVTTMDMIAIHKHLLGITIITDPEMLLAADVNATGTITVSDLIEIRKLILGNIMEFGNVPSWRFIDKAYVFPESDNPWLEEVPDYIAVQELAECLYHLDFVGIKMGDVNNTATTLDSEEVQFRTEGQFDFRIEDRPIRKGEVLNIPFTAPELEDILGYQFTLDVNREYLEFVSLEEGVSKKANFGFEFVQNGRITTSWHDVLQIIDSEETTVPVMFELKVLVKKDAESLNGLLTINSAYTKAEAYGVDGRNLNVGIQLFEDGNMTASNELGYQLYQNIPNPTSESTRIAFEIPDYAEITLVIRDVSGKEVMVLTDFFEGGFNEVLLQTASLSRGVYYYTLSTDEFTATKKMIVN